MVYAAVDIAYDALDGDPIDQNGPYRAIIGVSDNLVNGEPRIAFAIVRTGGYAEYGFGGFIYERNGGVTLPIARQAYFEGEYAGVRIYQNRIGLELTTGDIAVDIDFSDFNANDADALLQRKSDDTAALILRAEAAIALGDFLGATRFARAAYYAQTRGVQKFAAARLVALAHSQLKKDSRAQVWLRRARQYAPNAQTARSVAGMRFGFGIDAETRDFVATRFLRSEPRADISIALNMSVEFADWEFYGFCPVLNAQIKRDQSNVDLFDRDYSSLGFDLRSSF